MHACLPACPGLPWPALAPLTRCRSLLNREGDEQDRQTRGTQPRPCHVTHVDSDMFCWLLQGRHRNAPVCPSISPTTTHQKAGNGKAAWEGQRKATEDRRATDDDDDDARFGHGHGRSLTHALALAWPAALSSSSLLPATGADNTTRHDTTRHDQARKKRQESDHSAVGGGLSNHFFCCMAALRQSNMACLDLLSDHDCCRPSPLPPPV